MPSTSNYNWQLPAEGGDQGSWGGKLNTVLTAVDAALKAVSNVASAALAKAGGTMTGRADLHSASLKVQTVASTSGTVTLDLSTGQYWVINCTGNFDLALTAPPAGQVAYAVVLVLKDGFGKVLSWPNVRWGTSGAPQLSLGGKTDVVLLLIDPEGTKGFLVESGM
jgi:hypothetical protein